VFYNNPTATAFTKTFLKNFDVFFSATSIAIEPESQNLYIVNNEVDSIEVASLDLPNVISVLHVSDIHSAWQMAISHSSVK